MEHLEYASYNKPLGIEAPRAIFSCNNNSSNNNSNSSNNLEKQEEEREEEEEEEEQEEYEECNDSKAHREYKFTEQLTKEHEEYESYHDQSDKIKSDNVEINEHDNKKHNNNNEYEYVNNNNNNNNNNINNNCSNVFDQSNLLEYSNNDDESNYNNNNNNSNNNIIDNNDIMYVNNSDGRCKSVLLENSFNVNGVKKKFADTNREECTHPRHDNASEPNFQEMVVEEVELTVQNRYIIGTNYSIDFNLLNIEEDATFPEIKVLRIKLRGVLFFGSCMEFVDGFLVLLHTYHCEIFLKVTDFILDFQDGLMPVMDFSAAEAIQDVGRILGKRGIRTHVQNMDPMSFACFERCRRYFPDIEEDDVNNVKEVCFLRRIFKIESTYSSSDANQIAQPTHSPLNDDVFLRANQSFVVVPLSSLEKKKSDAKPVQEKEEKYEYKEEEEEELQTIKESHGKADKELYDEFREDNSVKDHGRAIESANTTNTTITGVVSSSAMQLSTKKKLPSKGNDSREREQEQERQTTSSLLLQPTPASRMPNTSAETHEALYSIEVQVPLSESIKIGFPIYRPQFDITVPVFATVTVWKERMQETLERQCAIFDWDIGLTPSKPFNRQFGDIGKLWWNRLWNKDIKYDTEASTEPEPQLQEQTMLRKSSTDAIHVGDCISENEPVFIKTSNKENINNANFMTTTSSNYVMKNNETNIGTNQQERKATNDNNINDNSFIDKNYNYSLKYVQENNVSRCKGNRTQIPAENKRSQSLLTETIRVWHDNNNNNNSCELFVHRRAPTQIIQVPRFPGQGFAKEEKLSRFEYIEMQRVIYHELFQTEPPAPPSRFTARMMKFEHDLISGFI